MLGTIEYNSSVKESEKVCSMCFASNDTLLIATELQNYYVDLNDEKMFKKYYEKNPSLKENWSNEEAILHMTSAPDNQKE